MKNGHRSKSTYYDGFLCTNLFPNFIELPMNLQLVLLGIRFSIVTDFPDLAVTNIGCLISDRRLRLLCYIKLYFKSEPSNFKLTVIINLSVKLGYLLTTVNPGPSGRGKKLGVALYF
jgi:hypothetical protein